MAVLCENEQALRESLDQYYDMWVRMCVEFEAIGRKFTPF
jgi:hypothetical protein